MKKNEIEFDDVDLPGEVFEETELFEDEEIELDTKMIFVDWNEVLRTLLERKRDANA